MGGLIITKKTEEGEQVWEVGYYYFGNVVVGVLVITKKKIGKRDRYGK